MAGPGKSPIRYDDRQMARLSLFVPVWLAFDGRRESGYLVNLSTTGAKVFTHALPPVGQAMRLEWEEQSYPCQCVWTKSRLCGITFDQPLGDRALARMLA